MISKEDRLPLYWQNTREYQGIVREGVKEIGPINTQFPDQLSFPDQSSIPDLFSIGNSNHDPSKVNIDFDDLIIEGLQLEESRKIKKQKKVEQRRRTKKRPGTSEEHKF